MKNLLQYIIATALFTNLKNTFPSQSSSNYRPQYTEKKFMYHLVSKSAFKNELQEWIFCSKKKKKINE